MEQEEYGDDIAEEPHGFPNWVQKTKGNDVTKNKMKQYQLI